MKIVHVKEDDEKKSKRQNILDAAFVVFSQKGFHKATIDEIIALADTGKGTVYNYFTNKEQLFFTLLEERERSYLARFNEMAGSTEAPLRKLAQMIRIQLEFFTGNTSLWQILLHELRALYDGPLANVDKLRGDSCRAQYFQRISAFAKVIREGQQCGVIKATDADRAASMLFSMILGTALGTGGQYDALDRASSIEQLFFYGVVS